MTAPLIELVELPCEIITTGRGKKGMSSEECGKLIVTLQPQLSGELKVRTEVFEKIDVIACPKFVWFCLMLSVIFCYKLWKYFPYLR